MGDYLKISVKKISQNVILMGITVSLLVGFNFVFAESETQTLPTDKGTLNVRLSHDEIVPGQLTTLKTEFINPQTQKIQEHIDWRFSVSKDGETIWGPTQLSHTSKGSLDNLKYEFQEDGMYNFEFEVEGILFQPIPLEKVTFDVIVGDKVPQTLVSIDAHTSKNFYDYGESVGVNGKIKNYDKTVHSNLVLAYLVLDPSGELITLGQTDPSSFGSFSFSFVARGNQFESSGDYSIQLVFGPAKGEIPMYLSGGETEIRPDAKPPKILQPENIEVSAETNDGIVLINFDVLVTDDTDEMILPLCKPSSGYLFGIGDTIVKCTARDSAGNFAIPVYFTVTVNPPETSIPSWVKNVAEFWCEDKIDDSSFVEGIQYLIDNGIIIIPLTSQSGSDSQEVPQWVKNNACWWSAGSITDKDFASGIEYLVSQGIIRV